VSPCTLTGTARVGSADTARPHSGAARFRPDGGLEGTALPSDTAEGLGEGTTLKKGGKKLANDKKSTISWVSQGHNDYFSQSASH